MAATAPRRHPYNARTAHRMAVYAARAYESEQLLRADYGRRFYSFLTGDYHNRFGVKIADTEAYILASGHGRGISMVLAFRGTESLLAEPADWLTNLDITLVPRDWLPSPGGERPRMHRGFLRAYETVRERVIAAVKDVEPRHVYATGHSLGGALATLAAMDIKTHFPDISVTMYSFGAPRVGDPAFARLYDRTVRDSHRVVHDGDRAAEQLAVGYEHVRKEHLLERHPDSRYPHHYIELYLDRLGAESGLTGWPGTRGT